MFDITGRCCRTFATGKQKPGNYSLTRDHDDDESRQLVAGIYFVRLDADDGVPVRKAVLER